MNAETVVKLNRFQCRNYQAPIFDAIENKGYKKVLAILPRRAGKDVAAFNLMIRSALRKVGVYYYILLHTPKLAKLSGTLLPMMVSDSWTIFPQSLLRALMALK